MDAKESIFKNVGGAVFGKDKSDILKDKYHIREKSQVPAPGNYNSAFSEFSGPPEQLEGQKSPQVSPRLPPIPKVS